MIKISKLFIPCKREPESLTKNVTDTLKRFRIMIQIFTEVSTGYGLYESDFIFKKIAKQSFLNLGLSHCLFGTKAIQRNEQDL